MPRVVESHTARMTLTAARNATKPRTCASRQSTTGSPRAALMKTTNGMAPSAMKIVPAHSSGGDLKYPKLSSWVENPPVDSAVRA
jgi:hypothetical protein